MKKVCTTICMVVLLGSTMQAQLLRHVPTANAKVMKMAYSELAQAEHFDSPQSRTGSQLSPSTPNLTVSSVNTALIGSSQNIFTFSDARQRQLSALPNVGSNGGSVGFIYRQNANTCGGNSGSFFYDLSNDGGNSWLSTTQCGGLGSLNPNLTMLGRYPNMLLWANASATPKIAFSGAVIPTTPNATWNGYALLGMATDIGNVAAGPTITQERYVSSGTPNLYRPVSILKRNVQNDFWAMMEYPVSQEGDSAVDIWKGTYLPTYDSIDWAMHQHISFKSFKNVENKFMLYQPIFTFSPNGQKGAIVMMGDILGGKDSVFVPIVLDFDEGTETFGDPYEITSPTSSSITLPLDNRLYDSLASYSSTFVDANNQVISNTTTCVSIDAAFDINGHLHLLTALMPGGNFAQNDPIYSYYPGFGGRVIHYAQRSIDMKWDAHSVSPIHRYSDELGTGTAALSLSCKPYITSSENGEFFFFNWKDSDTSVSTTDPIGLPNLVGCSYNTNLNTISDTINWTNGDVSWGGLIYTLKTSNLALPNPNNSCEFQVPVVTPYFPDISNPTGTYIDFFYLKNIHYCTNDANIPADWVSDGTVSSNTNITSKLGVKLYPNPTKELLTIELDLAKAGDVQLEILGANGQQIRKTTISSMGHIKVPMNVSELISGIYLVKITSVEGISTQKLVIE